MRIRRNREITKRCRRYPRNSHAKCNHQSIKLQIIRFESFLVFLSESIRLETVKEVSSGETPSAFENTLTIFLEGPNSTFVLN